MDNMGQTNGQTDGRTDKQTVALRLPLDAAVVVMDGFSGAEESSIVIQAKLCCSE